MPFVDLGRVELYYETHGSAGGPSLLLIQGLGRQVVDWPQELIEGLATAGLHVFTFDNRDVGLSTKLDHLGKMPIGEMYASLRRGEPVHAPYDLSDMAEDASALLDALSIERAHVLGVSMGGMIAQELAYLHPDRVRSLISVMSTTGARKVGAPTPEALAVLLVAPSPDLEQAIAAEAHARQVIGTPGAVDPARARSEAEVHVRRSFHPPGVGRQLAAIWASGDRTDHLRAIRVPALVIHGTADPLIDVSGGRATAAAIPGAHLVEIPGMAHDLPPSHLTEILATITDFLATV